MRRRRIGTDVRQRLIASIRDYEPVRERYVLAFPGEVFTPNPLIAALERGDAITLPKWEVASAIPEAFPGPLVDSCGWVRVGADGTLESLDDLPEGAEHVVMGGSLVAAFERGIDELPQEVTND